MAILTCTLCRKSFESGPDHCPHCRIRLPGASAPQSPARRRSGSGGAPRGARVRKPATDAPPAPAGQCPACAHPITVADEWCKWCHWPVNRR